ncbi:HlyD family efflux transporter periplasmic adaptor subunit [Sinorhizobium medicae]|nr:HlyD family efflux transporter periplasmic adaptor subunit [Sinorhizobium medicae]MDX0822125.1 HlyD family efflux transporter periplasmic adaptor subunit [Sinorhizobium medicae]
MKRKIKGVASAATALLVFGVGAYFGRAWWQEFRMHERTDNAYVRADITAISPKVAGYVSTVLVDDNQVVEAGAILLRIDDDDYLAQRDPAAASVAQAEAAVGNLTRRKSLQLANIREAEAMIDVARADLELSRRELSRATRLVDQGWTAQRNHDTATAKAQSARATLVRAEAAAAAARAQLAVLDSESPQISARLAEARANLRLAEIALSETVIRAPVSGVVGNRKVREGEYVRPGSVLLSVVPLDGIWVVANLKETQLARVMPGQRAEIRVDGYSTTVIEGRVDSLAPASGAAFSLLPPDNATGNFIKVVQRVPVKIRLEPDHAFQGRLVPGLSVDVAIHLAPEPERPPSQSNPVAAGRPTSSLTARREP